MTPDRIFQELESDDAALAAEVASRLGMALPLECVPGVAANARLLQKHADTMKEQAE